MGTMLLILQKVSEKMGSQTRGFVLSASVTTMPLLSVAGFVLGP